MVKVGPFCRKGLSYVGPFCRKGLSYVGPFCRKGLSYVGPFCRKGLCSLLQPATRPSLIAGQPVAVEWTSALVVRHGRRSGRGSLINYNNLRAVNGWLERRSAACLFPLQEGEGGRQS